jgi:ABC-type Mn2+/Zn2+ transport system permease subunit
MFEWLQHDFMLQALVACSAMALLLAYLGIHVVGRGIVFVDLGLGQISSMGVAYALYAGKDPVFWSMLFTLVGAAVFSALRVEDERLRLEAVIGIFYAVSSALTVLLIARTPHGDADIQDVLFGNVLAQDPGAVRSMLIVFALVAAVHLLLGRRFFALTYRKGSGSGAAPGDHLMNFVFYLLLAFAIVFAIRAGGVIPVFAFLIIPPVGALVFARRTWVVVVLALGLSLVATFFGLHLSYVEDLPAGASIVAMLGLGGLIAGAWALVRRFRRPGRAAAALLLLGLAGGLAPRPAQAQGSADPAGVAAEVAALRAELAATRARLAELEQRLEQLAAPAPEPPAPAPPLPAAPRAGGGLRLIDISLGGLFTAGASSAPEEEFRLLELGGHDPKNRGVTLQNLELALSGAIDPYLRGDAYLIFQIDEEGESFVEVEEAYLTTLALPAGLQVKAGQFFAPFGRLNTRHPHGWDFVDQPVVNSRMLGPDGLRGLGAQLSWLLPTPFYAEATLDLQNSNGETAVSFRSVPGEEFAGRQLLASEVRSPGDLLWLGRLATSFDLTREITIVPAVSFARGPNATGPDAETSLAGFDFYGKWKPVANDHGWPFASLQLEAMERRYDAAAQALDDGSLLAAERLIDRGAYLQGLWGFRRRWVAGLRFDWADGRGDTADDPLRDLRRRWATNLTFYPSEFSKLRLQYNRDEAEHLDDIVSSLLLQFEFLYGAHGGHKF